MVRFYITGVALVLVTSSLPSAIALQALTNSPCASQCGNTLSSTEGNRDIVCPDSSYTGATGVTFQSCISCQLGSTYVDPTTHQTDLQWALYNMRYAISWCLFGYPKNTNVPDTPCITSTACGPLQNAFEFDGLAPNASTFGYCSLLNNNQNPKCTACLQIQSAEYYLNNFFSILSGACTYQPTSGKMLEIEGSVFSTTQANVTQPSAAPSNYIQSTGLSLGAKVGIAIAGVVGLLFIIGFCIICNGRRRRRRALEQKARENGLDDWRENHQFSDEPQTGGGGFQQQQPPPQMQSHSNYPIAHNGGGGGSYYDSPQSQRPVMPWPPGQAGEDWSPASAITAEKYFSPYSSNYSSPVSANELLPVRGQEWPMDRKGSINQMMGRSRSLEKKGLHNNGNEEEGDRIEMQNVPPVLLHPRSGRMGMALTEDDARRGYAM